MKVLIDGKLAQMTYREVCHRLGFIPEVQFVHVTRAGRIGFSCGKPDEICSLRAAISREKMTPSARKFTMW